MTYAEQTAANGDDEHMIYEMFQFSQYEDGSVLDCQSVTTWTAQEVVDGLFRVISAPISIKLGRDIESDVKRNAKAALKNGTTRNLAPRV